MQTISRKNQVPVYALEPDGAGIPNFRVYNFAGDLPNHSDLLIPHRKDHYLFVFIRQANTRQWIDMTPYQLKNKTVYFTSPNQVILKEEFKQLWSTGIAFTKEFLSLQENAGLARLPVIRNPNKGYEILLTPTDIDFIEDTIGRINTEYRTRSEWQQRMLTAYLTLLLTYLSRLYDEQYPAPDLSEEKLLLQKFQAKINENFREQHEVGDYAAGLHMTAGHLSEVVKEQSGRPAIKHIHERLVMEARRLLFHTDQSSKEIGFDLGFSEASYFNRFFKRETGLTPAAYRAGIRKMYH